MQGCLEDVERAEDVDLDGGVPLPLELTGAELAGHVIHLVGAAERPQQHLEVADVALHVLDLGEPPRSNGGRAGRFDVEHRDLVAS